MQEKLGFEEAVDRIVRKDPRYRRDAYFFLREALDFTVKQLKREKNADRSQHVSGPELLDGVRRYALEQFGPMVPTVFGEWGLHASGHVGDMVFNLIELEVFGKSENDRREDFEDVFSFEDAFITPFRPRRSFPGNPVVPN